MSSDSQSSMTVGSLLFGHENEDPGALVLSPSWDQFEASLDKVPAELAGMTRETVGREVATAISDAEDLQLGDLMIYGWRTHRHLIEAARRSLQEPGKREVVQLAAHRLTATRHPVVDLTADQVVLYSAHFTVTVTFDVDLADAVVDQGKLTKMTTGGFSVLAVLEAELPAGNVEMIRRRHRVESRLVIPLGQGVVLLGPEPGRHVAGVAAPRLPLDAAEQPDPAAPPGDVTGRAAGDIAQALPPG
jgi:hypothetical protein